MKKTKSFLLVIMFCSSIFMTGCDVEQIVGVITNISQAVQEAVPAISNVINTISGALDSLGSSSPSSPSQSPSAPADVATNQPAQVPIPSPLDENIGGGSGANGNSGSGASSEAAQQAEAALENYNGGRLAPAEFARLFGPIARESMRRTGVPASVILAQAALETGWGASSIGDAKNLFGIKGTGPAGSIRVPTQEVVNGRRVTIQDNFRKYNSWQESFEDHGRLLSQNSRYATAMRYTNDPDRFAREIHRAGYATDPEYSNLLISIMRSNNLYQFDS